MLGTLIQRLIEAGVVAPAGLETQVMVEVDFPDLRGIDFASSKHKVIVITLAKE